MLKNILKSLQCFRKREEELNSQLTWKKAKRNLRGQWLKTGRQNAVRSPF